MAARIIAVSNPPGLRRVPALLMRDNCQGDERAVTKPREADKTWCQVETAACDFKVSDTTLCYTDLMLGNVTQCITVLGLSKQAAYVMRK